MFAETLHNFKYSDMISVSEYSILLFFTLNHLSRFMRNLTYIPMPGNILVSGRLEIKLKKILLFDSSIVFQYFGCTDIRIFAEDRP